MSAPKPILVTGGCGFIGCNIVDALASRGEHVRVLDALLRNGVKENAQWLQARHRERVTIDVADVRDRGAVDAAVEGAAGVFHLAGQVAVTTSLDDPIDDFEINARGTLNILEAVRLKNPDAPVVFASTNKVYGRLLADNEARSSTNATGRRCGICRTVSARRHPSISTAPTAAPRVRQTSTCATMPVCSACAPPCCA